MAGAARKRRKAAPEKAAGADEIIVDPNPPPRFVVPIADSPIELERPVEYGGRTYTRIIRRRPSSGVIGRWMERWREIGTEGSDTYLSPPIFVDDDGMLVPDAVLGFLDDDDKERVYEGTDPFSPRRLEVAMEALTKLDQAPASPSGEPAEPTSSAS